MITNNLPKNPMEFLGISAHRLRRSLVGTSRLLNTDALWGIAMPARESEFKYPEAVLNADALSNVEALAGFDPKGL